jgi:hypothetical protein
VAEAGATSRRSGASPLAITDNLNFGNPERPEVMGQFVGCIRGIGEACRALDFPVVSGNVSLYNETNGQGILPTPTIGGVGVVDDVRGARLGALQARGRRDPARSATTAAGSARSIYLARSAAGKRAAPRRWTWRREAQRRFVRQLILPAVSTRARLLGRRLACRRRDGDGGRHRGRIPAARRTSSTPSCSARTRPLRAAVDPDAAMDILYEQAWHPADARPHGAIH